MLSLIPTERYETLLSKAKQLPKKHTWETKKQTVKIKKKKITKDKTRKKETTIPKQKQQRDKYLQEYCTVLMSFRESITLYNTKKN